MYIYIAPLAAMDTAQPNSVKQNTMSIAPVILVAYV